MVFTFSVRNLKFSPQKTKNSEFSGGRDTGSYGCNPAALGRDL